MARSPAFRFYPSDFIGSPDVQAMDLHEVGAYTLLLCTAWLSERHGHLPDDEKSLRRWARMSKDEWAESRECLLKKFPVVEEGWRANPRMVIEAEKQRLFSEAQSLKGKQGGRPLKKPGLSEIKPGVSKQKPEESRTKAHEKPSVSAFVSVSVSGEDQDISVATQPHPAVAGQIVTPEQEIYKLYPRKEGSAAALVAIEKAVVKLVKGKTRTPRDPMVRRDAQKLLYRAVEAYGRSPVGQQPDKTKLPHPATWFNQERWDDDQSNWQQTGGSNGRSDARVTEIIHGRNDALALFGGVDIGQDFHGRTLEAGRPAGPENQGIHGSAVVENAR